MNYCDFFRRIEANPSAIVKNLTIGQYYGALEHMKECQECSDICDRVVEQAPPETKIGFNRN